MFVRCLALIATTVLAQVAISAPVERQAFALFEKRVTFSVPGDWVIFRKDSNHVGERVIFQVKNPADEGTPDSANVFVYVYRDPKLTVEGLANSRAAYVTSLPGGLMLNRHDGEKPNADMFYQSTFHQGQTPYSGFERVARRGDVLVMISAAWPLLDKTTQAWTDAWIADVNALFKDLAIDGASIGSTSTIKEQSP